MGRNYPALERVLMVTFLLNVLVTIAKLGVGLWVGALSLVADNLDTLFDGLSNIVGLVAVRISRQSPDDDHPYGHRKFETRAARFIAAALFVAAWELITGAISRFFNPSPPLANRWSILALLFNAASQGIIGCWEYGTGILVRVTDSFFCRVAEQHLRSCFDTSATTSKQRCARLK